jgi:predicted glutamine amidotransferase
VPVAGMNCNVPTDICFSFAGFQARGGATDVHADGWGIAFFEGRGTRVFLDPQPSCVFAGRRTRTQLSDPFAKRHCAHPQGDAGRCALENTHPFMRELWGRYWIFAHNGNLPIFRRNSTAAFTPVGETDSERAFCWLLQNLRQRFGSRAPSQAQSVRGTASADPRSRARRRVQLSAVEWRLPVRPLLHQLSYIIRQAPFAVAHLRDQDLSIDFSDVTTPEDRVAVIATVPLTDNECWTTMPSGSLWLFEEGAPVSGIGSPSPGRPNEENAPS